MIATVHQPNYLPWIGLFSKIRQADCFVIADTFPYTKHNVTNRNRIRTNAGWFYITIPLDRKWHLSRILDVKLPSNNSWRETHWKSIYQNYAKANFFRYYKDFFEEIYHRDFKYLCELNMEIILYLLKCFEIEAKVLKTSEMEIDPGLHGTDAIIAILKAVGAETYLSGPSGRDYLDFEKVKRNNIKLRFLHFEHPVYEQRFPGFEANMSAIDLLFNRGPEAAEIIKAAASIED